MDKDVSDFLQASFRSVWSLELMLVLLRAPDRTWTAQELISELRSSEAVIRQSLDDLLAAGLILVDDEASVRFLPASDDLHDMVPRVTKAYQVEPTAVRRVIVQRPTAKLRNFSDAFRIGRKD